MNAVILLAVLSGAICTYYSARRIIHSFSEQFYPLPFLVKVDKKGRAVTCMMITSLIGLISFFAAAPFRVEFFNWLLALSGLAVLFVFFGFNMAHIRFRGAMKIQNRSLNELAFVSPTGVVGSYWGIFMVVMIFIAQFWVALTPMGTYTPNAQSFFQNYLCAILWIISYLGYKLYHKNWQFLIPLDKIDIDKDRIIFNHEEIVQQEKEDYERMKSGRFAKRLLKFFC